MQQLVPCMFQITLKTSSTSSGCDGPDSARQPEGRVRRGLYARTHAPRTTTHARAQGGTRCSVTEPIIPAIKTRSLPVLFLSRLCAVWAGSPGFSSWSCCDTAFARERGATATTNGTPLLSRPRTAHSGRAETAPTNDRYLIVDLGHPYLSILDIRP